MKKYTQTTKKAGNAKILLLITNLGTGGAQRVFYDHSKFLSEQFEVVEAVFDIHEAPNLYPSNNRQLSLNVKGSKGIFNKVRNFYLRCKTLRELIAKENIDICISHMDGANWVNVLSFSKAKKVLVVHGTVLHDQNIKKFFQYFRTRFLIPFVYNRANATVTVSEGIKYEMEQYCAVRNVTSISNFFDLKDIAQMAAESLNDVEQKLFNDHFTLITSGRLAEQKKQRVLFPVYKEVLRLQPGTKLIFLGDGELRQELLAEARNYGFRVYSVWGEQSLTDAFDVYFFGYIQNPFKYLAKSTLFLFPSAWEGFPMALCEAMASGVPVLSCDCPTGPRQILAPGSFDTKYELNSAEFTDCGVLLPMPEKKVFTNTAAQVTLKLLSNEGEKERLKLNALNRVANFDKEIVIHQWLKLIKYVN